MITLFCVTQVYVVIEESDLKVSLSVLEGMNYAQREEYITSNHLEDVDYIGTKSLDLVCPVRAEWKQDAESGCKYWYENWLRLQVETWLWL